MPSPKVTVLMPVYNAEKYLKEAIESILNQRYDNFEFLIINDGSTDNSVDIIKSFKDSRITMVNNDKNMGLIATLNKGIQLSKGKYIARMDSDDISYPERLKKQVEFMEKNEDIAVCGTWVEYFSESSFVKKGFFKFPIDPTELKYHMMFRCSFIHPSVMIRASNFQHLKYDDNYECAEDFELWNRVNETYKFYNIPEVLLKYRLSEQGISRKKYHQQKLTSSYIRARIYKKMKIDIGEEFYDVCNIKIESLRAMEKNILKLKRKLENGVDDIKEIKYIQTALFEEWYELCRNATQNGLVTWFIFHKSILSRVPGNMYRKAKLFLKCLLCKETIS